jgi:hypothetical protein
MNRLRMRVIVHAHAVPSYDYDTITQALAAEVVTGSSVPLPGIAEPLAGFSVPLPGFSVLLAGFSAPFP